MTDALLTMIKGRCGIPEFVTVYDEPELKPLIEDALEDMRTAANRGSDRTDTARYMRLYRNKLHKLMLEPETAGEP